MLSPILRPAFKPLYARRFASTHDATAQSLDLACAISDRLFDAQREGANYEDLIDAPGFFQHLCAGNAIIDVQRLYSVNHRPLGVGCPWRPMVRLESSEGIYMTYKRRKSYRPYQVCSAPVDINDIKCWHPKVHDLRTAVKKMPKSLTLEVGRYLQQGYAFAGMNKKKRIVLVKADERDPHVIYSLPQAKFSRTNGPAVIAVKDDVDGCYA